MTVEFLGTTTCSADDFNCTKGVPSCVPMSWVCDGGQECTDSSDEEMDLCGEHISLDHDVNIYVVNFVIPFFRKVVM